MGLLNVLQAKWDGKVGQTVGAKWKNKATIRAYAKPANPNTANQQSIREIFRDASGFIALFSDQIKTLTSLNTRSMSVRNAIIKANKDQFTVGGAFDPQTLLVNKGGLVGLSGVAYDASSDTLTWTPPTATNISAKALVVGLWVDPANKKAQVVTAPAVDGTMSNVGFGEPPDSYLYYWMIDYRGSTRVGCNSVPRKIA